MVNLNYKYDGKRVNVTDSASYLKRSGIEDCVKEINRLDIDLFEKVGKMAIEVDVLLSRRAINNKHWSPWRLLTYRLWC